MPQPRPIDLPAAVLLATAALALAVAAGCAVLLVALVAVAGRDAVALDGGGWESACAAAAVACATVAALMALTRPAGGLHPAALGAVWAVGFAWPLAGAPVPAAVAALGLTALAVRLDPRTARRRDDAPAAAALVALALGLLLVAAGEAPMRSARAPAIDPAARTAGGEGGGIERAATSHARAANAGERRSACISAGTSPAGGGNAGVRRCRRAPGAGAPARPAASAPAATVRAYYAALDARDFDAAASRLSRTVLASFGGEARWRAGFARTLSSTPAAIATATEDGAATVHLTLTARDRAACGTATQRFAVTWRLALDGDGRWIARRVTGTPLGPPVC